MKKEMKTGALTKRGIKLFKGWAPWLLKRLFRFSAAIWAPA
jgi:hypothetical protein